MSGFKWLQVALLKHGGGIFSNNQGCGHGSRCIGGDGRTAARHCLGKGKLRVTEEKRTPEKDEVLEVEEGESLVLQGRH